MLPLNGSFESPSTFRPKNHRTSAPGKPSVTFTGNGHEEGFDELDMPSSNGGPMGGSGDHVTFALPGKNSVLDSATVNVQVC